MFSALFMAESESQQKDFELSESSFETQSEAIFHFFQWGKLEKFARRIETYSLVSYS